MLLKDIHQKSRTLVILRARDFTFWLLGDFLMGQSFYFMTYDQKVAFSCGFFKFSWNFMLLKHIHQKSGTLVIFKARDFKFWLLGDFLMGQNLSCIIHDQKMPISCGFSFPGIKKKDEKPINHMVYLVGWGWWCGKKPHSYFSKQKLLGISQGSTLATLEHSILSIEHWTLSIENKVPSCWIFFLIY